MVVEAVAGRVAAYPTCLVEDPVAEALQPSALLTQAAAVQDQEPHPWETVVAADQEGHPFPEAVVALPEAVVVVAPSLSPIQNQAASCSWAAGWQGSPLRAGGALPEAARSSQTNLKQPQP